MDAVQDPRPESLPPEVAKRLPEWREQYGSDLLYTQACGGVLFRPFTRGELIRFELNANHDPVLAQISLFQDCVIHPASWDDLTDKLSLREFQALFKCVWDASGFRDPDAFEADLNRIRVMVHQRDHAIVRAICSAFPSLSPKDVDKMTRLEILYHLAQAEAIAGQTFDGRELGEVVEPLIIQAQQEEQQELLRLRAQGEDVPEAQKFFDWKKDLQELMNFEGG